MRTDAQRRAENRHEKEHERIFKLKANRRTNAAEIAHLEAQPNMNGYMMGLIRKDMKGRKMKTVDEILSNWETERDADWYAVDEIAADGREMRLLVADGDSAKRYAAQMVTGENLVDYEGNPCEPGEFGDQPFYRCQLIGSDEAKAYFERCTA